AFSKPKRMFQDIGFINPIFLQIIAIPIPDYGGFRKKSISLAYDRRRKQFNSWPKLLSIEAEVPRSRPLHQTSRRKRCCLGAHTRFFKNLIGKNSIERLK